MQYLADQRCTVIALRDLAKYVDPAVVPNNPQGVIEDRIRLLKAGQTGDNSRPAKDDDELRYWLQNMFAHDFTLSEIGAALGLTARDVEAARRRLRILRGVTVKPADRLFVLPYPGGRHPRIGFLDGAIRPQRETKVSVFAPWHGYAVVDVPEAIWFVHAGKRELLYLAHTHIPTVWDRKGVSLPPREWQRGKDGKLHGERRLPNGVTFGASVVPGKDGVRMACWLHNGTKETLTGLNVQMCVMLKGLQGFDDRTNANKVFAPPFAACRDQSGKRWVITGWQPCVRTWGNPPCPCLHSDPRIPDCAPGKTEKVTGWLSFYEGTDIDAELRRLRATVFAAAGTAGK
jgi:hypothetical protein